jgi:hypothetical protein
LSIWSKVAGAVKRIIPRKRRREPEVPPEPPRQPPPPPRTIDTLVDELYALGVATSGSHSVTAIHELTDAVGQRNARSLLRQQVESTQAWIRGNVEPGRSRWFGRDEWMRDHADEIGHGTLNIDYDVFFWYHAKRR